MPDLVNATRAALFVLVRRPAVWVLLLAAVVLDQIFNYLVPYLSYRTGDDAMGDVSGVGLLAAMMPDRVVSSTIGGFPVFAGALALVLGALVLGSEYGWGTVKTLLTQRPGRLATVGGQLLAVAAAVAVGVAVMIGLSALSATGIAVAEGQPVTWASGGDLAAGVGAGYLILLMWALLGAMLGVVLRGVALAIGLGVVWVLGIENLVSAMAGSVLSALQPLRDVLPGVNSGSLVAAVTGGGTAGAPPGVTSSVDGTRALVTLICYVLVCVVVALWATRTRDVL